MFKKILIAYDGSVHSQRALDCAKDLAGEYAAQLIVVHAFHPISKEWGAPFLQEAEGHAMRLAENVMKEVQSKLANIAVEVVSAGGAAG
jgi:nucleotide-binding universal stress UspA family protein